MKDLSQKEWKEGIEKDKNAEILGVRTKEEFLEKSIPGARNIDIHKGQKFLDDVETLDKGKNYYVYCRSGARSSQACALMEQQGFQNAYNLVGGITDWEGDVKQGS
jgi:rhodanese-related sulfurtransferase